jgi:hypothetical protein
MSRVIIMSLCLLSGAHCSGEFNARLCVCCMRVRALCPARTSSVVRSGRSQGCPLLYQHVGISSCTDSLFTEFVIH